jgi:hypothetical protein
MKKNRIVMLIAILLAAILSVSSVYISYETSEATAKPEVYFGVTYGGNTAQEAERLIDKVKDYTNLFIVDSYDITNGGTSAELDAICSYASNANLNFIVYFFSFYDSTWKQEWADSAKQRWGDKFLGVYLRDEPGGRQIDTNETVSSASSYAEAASEFIDRVSSTFSVQFLKSKQIPIYTSDYALYWYDFKAGYDTIFAELGWNNTREKQIALCRGAADTLGKEWGTIITWTYENPPYIASGPEIYQDMITSYDAGAKYILVFDYPQYPENNPYGILAEEHFSAMKQFWNYIQKNNRPSEQVKEAVYILPENYGWGLRRTNDTIWGLWQPDNLSSTIWQNINQLIQQYSLKLNIIYDGEKTNLEEIYPNVYFWNQKTV